MSEHGQAPTSLQFGTFELSFESRELRKNGVRLKLSGQAMQVLIILAERPGQLVSREELQQKLWAGDSYGDFEHGLNAAVNRLRETLCDSATEHVYIDTLPRRGYRFIGPIREHPLVASITSESKETTQPYPAPISTTDGTGDRQNWLKIGAWIFFGAVLATTTLFGYYRFRPSPQPATLTALPFTAYSGTEVMPAFSPDGSQIAFAWDGDPPPGSKGFDLYIKVVGSETLLRLTHHPSEELIGIAWSPDGIRIAFHRISGTDSGVYVIPALGGPEKKLRSTDATLPWPAVSISWSPDGKWIAFADSTGYGQRIFLLSPEGLESKQISHAEGCLHDVMPAFSHDGKQLAYLCLLNFNDWKNGIYSMAISGGTPRLIATFVGWNAPSGIAWTGDDKKLILSRPMNKAEYELDEVTIAEGSMRSFSFGQNPTWPAISSRGDKLAFTSSSNQVNIWRKDLLHPQAPAVKLISSTHEQRLPQYSPDGKHIAFTSSRGGISEIWISDADGTQLVQISNFKNSWTGTPRWSPDSKKIAFDSRRSGHPEVYVADISELMPRKLVTNITEMHVPSWSHDGKWIYFQSSTPTLSLPIVRRIYRSPADGGNAVQLSLSDQQCALESFDGKAVYFTDEGRFTHHVGFAKISEPQVANESIVEGMPSMWSTDVWTVTEGGIYFAPEDSPRSIRYFDFKTKQVRQIFDVEKDLDVGGGLAVSPDGRWILYSQVDGQGGDILLVENFR
jgi:Tol biopolymer transport system component